MVVTDEARVQARGQTVSTMTRPMVAGLSIAVVCMLLFVSVQAADPTLASYTWIDVEEFTSFDNASPDSFGAAMDLEGDLLVIGSPGDKPWGDTKRGSIHVRHGPLWVDAEEGGKILASDGVPYASFGASVATDGNTIVVGAPGQTVAGIASGAVYLYEQDESGDWMETRLEPPTPSANARFGSDVDIHQGRIIVGAPNTEVNGQPRVGAAYVFDDQGGQWTATELEPPINRPNGYFGRVVSIAGDKAVVNAIGHRNEPLPASSVYLFEIGSGAWDVREPLPQPATASDRVGYYGFGAHITEDWIIASQTATWCCYWKPYSRPTLYVDANDDLGWDPTVVRLTEEGSVGDYLHFGQSIDVDGDRILVGAPEADADYDYLFGFCTDECYHTGMATLIEMTHDGPAARDIVGYYYSPSRGGRFGSSVAIQGPDLFIGAPNWGGEVTRFVSAAGPICDTAPDLALCTPGEGLPLF